jgi:tetratricopeptide (TPR) repeat protein
MLFAPDWTADTAHLSATEPAPARELFARWTLDLIDRDEAEAALHRARVGTDEFPDYATGWYMRARAEAALRRHAEARISAERCLALEPEFFAAWKLLETINTHAGHPLAALSAQSRLHDLFGNRTCESTSESTQKPRAGSNESPEDLKKGTETESSAALTPTRLVLRKSAPSVGAFETPTLAEVYRRQGLFDRALEVYRRILERHPDDAGAQAMVAKLENEMRTGRHKQGRA